MDAWVAMGSDWYGTAQARSGRDECGRTFDLWAAQTDSLAQHHPELENNMKQSTLRSTTALMVVLSFGQPLPVIAQSSNAVDQNDRRDLPLVAEENPLAILPEAQALCVEDGITDPAECAVLLQSLDVPAAEDPAPGALAKPAPDQAVVPPIADVDAAPAPDAAGVLPLDVVDDVIVAPAPQGEAPALADTDAVDTRPVDAAALAARQAQADAVTADASMPTIAGSDAGAETAADFSAEMLTEDTQRSSAEEFTDAPATTDDSGLSDLERAGLLTLGAVAVGAILLNGQRVQSRTGDRVIVVDDAGTPTVLKDDDALLRTPGAEVRTQRFEDGSTRTEVLRDDGIRIVTIRDVNGRALRRVRIEPDGREYVLIDDTGDFAPVILRDLPPPQRPATQRADASDREALRLALLAAGQRDLGRSFSLRQVREIVEVRELALEINLGGITFETNSAAILPEQAEKLREMGLLMQDIVRDNPAELFLVEGHTDAIGEAGANLLLSDRRAESVALAFNEYFGVSAENMIVQGYGERFLNIQTQSAERQNRRVAVRRITTLIRQN
jgi:outer membrane protein OmpA-like peptidoglycan-associated protein